MGSMMFWVVVVLGGAVAGILVIAVASVLFFQLRAGNRKE